jgi:hypothetical protein
MRAEQGQGTHVQVLEWGKNGIELFMISDRDYSTVNFVWLRRKKLLPSRWKEQRNEIGLKRTLHLFEQHLGSILREMWRWSLESQCFSVPHSYVNALL